LTLAKGTKPRNLKRNAAEGNKGKAVNDQRPWL
jgi:hypothetical protein